MKIHYKILNESCHLVSPKIDIRLSIINNNQSIDFHCRQDTRIQSARRVFAVVNAFTDLGSRYSRSRRNRLPEIEVEAQHGTQQAVFARHRLESIVCWSSACSAYVILCTVYLSEVISLI